MASKDRKPILPAGRVRTPALLQMEATECGAASLAIMLGYYGRYIPLAQLRRECGVSRDGSKASNIITAAKAHGLQAKGFKKDIPGLGSLRYPYIVFWNFNHFLVVEGYRKGRVYLNDPASGRRTVLVEEFDESYTGVVLAMEPGPEFQRGGRKLSVASSLWERLRGSVGALLMCMFAALLMVFPGVAYPALLQVFIDKVLIQAYSGWARPIIIGILLTALFRGVLIRIESAMLRRLQQRLATVLSSGFVWHLLHLPSSYYAQRYAGELSGRIELNDSVADVLSGRLATTIIDGFMMVFYLSVMLQFDRVLTGIGVIFAALNFVVLRWVGTMRVDGNNQLAHLGGKSLRGGDFGSADHPHHQSQRARIRLLREVGRPFREADEHPAADRSAQSKPRPVACLPLRRDDDSDSGGRSVSRNERRFDHWTTRRLSGLDDQLSVAGEQSCFARFSHATAGDRSVSFG